MILHLPPVRGSCGYKLKDHSQEDAGFVVRFVSMSKPVPIHFLAITPAISLVAWLSHWDFVAGWVKLGLVLYAFRTNDA